MRVPAAPPAFDVGAFLNASDVQRAADQARDLEGYPHWDKVRRLRFVDEVSPEVVWGALQMTRRMQARPLPLRQVDGSAFYYTLPDVLLQTLQGIASQASGQVAMPGQVVSGETRDRYVVRSLMEEAITSSQLEGASTAHRVAKELLRSGREPRDVSERMIANNYRAMKWVQENSDDEITPEAILALHAIVTSGTLSDPGQEGRLQRPDEPRVGVWSNLDDIQLHHPPSADELPDRLDELCRFANADGPWMPMLLRAIVCHFMVGYDHYFADGNGRLARVLFYWVALREGAWLLEFTPISRILNDAPVKYARSYLETETDGGDVTYFALYQASVISRSIRELHAYLERKTTEQEKVRLLRPVHDLNHRQRAIVEGALRDSTLVLTVQSHAASHQVSNPTARADLRVLEKLGYLEPGGKRRRQESWREGPRLRESRLSAERHPKL